MPMRSPSGIAGTAASTNAKASRVKVTASSEPRSPAVRRSASTQPIVVGAGK
jgi:hypothetical protein